MPDIIPGFNSVTFLPPDPTLAALDSRTNSIVNAALAGLSAPLLLLVVGDGSATLPTRPSTSQPVGFNTTTQPPLTGTRNGGTTGMVPGLDVWLYNGGGGSGGGSGATTIYENPLGSGTYGNRPASTQPITWAGVVPPAGGGTVAGGTAQMAPANTSTNFPGDVFLQYTSA